MALPRTLPLHPVDLLSGLLIPQAQTYLLAAPPFDLDPGRVHARLAPLITDSFPRFCYRFGRRFGTWSELVLADDPTAPVTIVDAQDAEPLSALATQRPLGDRHWDLTLIRHQGLVIGALRFDHVLGHGELARRFATSVCDRLRHGAQATPPRLDPAQAEVFGELQADLTRRGLAAAPWAEYRRLALDTQRIGRLVTAMGLSFSEGLTLWLAYHIQAANRGTHPAGSYKRPLKALCFRMDPTTSPEPPLDPALGNDGLLLERWQMDPDGSFERQDGGPAAARRGLERFTDLYRAFPVKPLLDAALRLGLTAARRSPDTGPDKLVVNNLGRTHYPFFRPLFFDPQNQGDQFGLVYVDGNADHVQLQLAPSRRYLAHFPWDDFANRLHNSLVDPEGWVAGPKPRADGTVMP